MEAFRQAILDLKFADSCDIAQRTRYICAVYPGSIESNYTTLFVPSKWITNKVANGADDLIVNGCFVYETMGKTHKTRFCFFFNKTIASWSPYPDFFSFCPTGNDPD